jgi:hypothetical protein
LPKRDQQLHQVQFSLDLFPAQLDDIYGTVSGLVAGLTSLQESIGSSQTALSSAPLYLEFLNGKP